MRANGLENLQDKIEAMNAHERPATALMNVYKYYHKILISALDSDPLMIDFNRGPNHLANETAVVECGKVSKSAIIASCYALGETSKFDINVPDEGVVVYEARAIPGQYS